MSPINIPISPPSPLVDPLPEEFIAPPPPVIGYPPSEPPPPPPSPPSPPSPVIGDPIQESIFNQNQAATPQLSIEDRISRLEGQFGGLNNQFSSISNLISGPFSGGYSSYMSSPFGYGGNPFGYGGSPFGQSSFSPRMYGGIGGFMPYFG